MTQMLLLALSTTSRSLKKARTWTTRYATLVSLPVAHFLHSKAPLEASLTRPSPKGEFCVIIGRDIKDLPPSASIKPYILGYTAGNDVSSRYWQAPERCGSQHGYAKSFDSFAPIGPVVISPHILLDYTNLTITTWVNGEERQTTKLDDMIFSVEEILRHLSKGRTVRRGTVVLTGTPSGVGAFMKPPQWLKKGDVVEVELEGVGRIRNRFV
jgi:2-keto-4-pentenoate hydratase/2-oxohepta-3-ene-1,7-dioic acid hydratase in catechol pathway